MPRQVDRDARLDAICAAALAIALRSGFQDVTIRAVAAEAGASTSVVTHYVAGRDELLRLAVRRLVAARRRWLEGLLGEGPVDDPARALAAVARWAVVEVDATDRRLWFALVVGAQQDGVLRAELDAYNDWWDAVVRGLARRLAPDRPAADELADTVDVVVDGLLVAGFDAGEDWSAERRARVLDRLLSALGL